MYTLHVIEPANKDHLCINTKICWSLLWSLYTGFHCTLFNEPKGLVRGIRPTVLK